MIIFLVLRLEPCRGILATHRYDLKVIPNMIFIYPLWFIFQFRSGITGSTHRYDLNVSPIYTLLFHMYLCYNQFFYQTDTAIYHCTCIKGQIVNGTSPSTCYTCFILLLLFQHIWWVRKIIGQSVLTNTVHDRTMPVLELPDDISEIQATASGAGTITIINHSESYFYVEHTGAHSISGGVLEIVSSLPLTYFQSMTCYWTEIKFYYRTHS